MARSKTSAKDLMAKLKHLTGAGRCMQEVAERQKSYNSKELLKELTVACDQVRKASYGVVSAASDLLKVTRQIIPSSLIGAGTLDQEGLKDLRSALSSARATVSDVCKETVDISLSVLLELDRRRLQKVLDSASKIIDWGLTILEDLIPWSGTAKKAIDALAPGFSEKILEDLTEPVFQEACLEILRRGQLQISVAFALGKFAFATYRTMVEQE